MRQVDDVRDGLATVVGRDIFRNVNQQEGFKNGAVDDGLVNPKEPEHVAQRVDNNSAPETGPDMPNRFLNEGGNQVN